MNTDEPTLRDALNSLTGKTVQEVQHGLNSCDLFITFTDETTLEVHANEHGSSLEVEVLPSQETNLSNPTLKI